MKKVIIALLIQVYVFEGLCQMPNVGYTGFSDTPTYSLKQLQEDFKIFRGALEEIHPALYWYTSKQELDQHFDEVYAALNNGMSELEYFRMLAPLISMVRCSHLWFWVNDSMNQWLQSESMLLPLKLKFINGRAYCLQNNSTDSLSIQPGDEIVGINNHSVDSMIHLFSGVLSGDGYIETGKSKFYDGLFNFYYNKYLNDRKDYLIRFIDRNGSKREVLLAGLPNQKIKKNAQKYRKPESKTTNISLKFIDSSSVAFLKVSSFGWLQDGKPFNFNRTIRKCFKRINKENSRNLIIDLRDSWGGVDARMLKLYSYFNDLPKVSIKKMEFNSKEPEHLKYAYTQPFSIKSLASYRTAKKAGDSLYVVTRRKSLKPYKPSQPRFEGNVFVLVNGGTFSISANLAAHLKSDQRAIIIGEETGGSYYRNTAHAVILIKLPNTGIKLGIPTIRSIINVQPIEPFGRGVMPHYQISPSIQDILSGYDRELEFGLDLINKGK